jgi:Tfp pilus assembly protein PilF
VELFYRLGAIRQKMGERARAINMFQRALEIDASHAASRKALQDILGT